MHYIRKIGTDVFLTEPGNPREPVAYYHEATALIAAGMANALAYGGGAEAPRWEVIDPDVDDARLIYARLSKPPASHVFPNWKQRDMPWSSDLLGFSRTVTIGSHGCLLCDVASMASHAYGIEIDPPTANRRLRDVNGFVAGEGNMFLAKIVEAWPIFKLAGILSYPYPKSADCSKIDEVLNRGGYALVKVDFNPKTALLNEHWVLITKRLETGERYEIMDPWFGERANMPPAYALPGWTLARYCIYKVAMYERKNA